MSLCPPFLSVNPLFGVELAGSCLPWKCSWLGHGGDSKAKPEWAEVEGCRWLAVNVIRSSVYLQRVAGPCLRGLWNPLLPEPPCPPSLCPYDMKVPVPLPCQCLWSPWAPAIPALLTQTCFFLRPTLAHSVAYVLGGGPGKGEGQVLVLRRLASKVEGEGLDFISLLCS